MRRITPFKSMCRLSSDYNRPNQLSLIPLVALLCQGENTSQPIALPLQSRSSRAMRFRNLASWASFTNPVDRKVQGLPLSPAAATKYDNVLL